MAGNLLVVYLPVPLVLGRSAAEGTVFLMCCSQQLQIGLCFVWVKVTIMSLGAILHYFVLLNRLTFGQVPLNQLLVVLAFTEVYLWFLIIQMVYDSY